MTVMESEVDGIKSPPDSAKCDLVEVKLDEFKESMVSPNCTSYNGTFICDLVEVKLDEFKESMVSPNCTTYYGTFLSDLKEVKVEEVKQPSICCRGPKNENGSKKWEQTIAMILQLLLMLYLVPLHLHEAYVTDGLLSRRFAYFAVYGSMFLVSFIASLHMISKKTFMVLFILGGIGIAATTKWDLALLVSMAVILVLFTIFFCILVIYDKIFGPNSDCKDTLPSSQDI